MTTPAVRTTESGMQTAVRLFPIRAGHLFVCHDVFHGRSSRAFRDHGFICDLEDTRAGLARDGERFGALIYCRDHPVERNGPGSLCRCWRG